MELTSAEAAKLLRKLNDEHDSLLSNEVQSREFLAAVGEDMESVRPEYDYTAVQAQLDALEEKIRRLKHAINVFNIGHVVPGFDMTVDQLLVYIPQLTAKKNKLYSMKNRLAKTRDNSSYGRTGNIIDYRYANYDIAAAAADYDATADLLAKAQTALDLINSTEMIEIDL